MMRDEAPTSLLVLRSLTPPPSSRRCRRATSSCAPWRTTRPCAELAAWLRAPDEVERTAAIDAVFHLSARLGGLRDAPLARAAREAMRAGTVRIAPSTRAMLEERIATLLDRP